MQVEIKELPEQRVATVSHVGPYDKIGPAFMKLGEIAGAAGLFGPGAAMIGVYHDDPRTTPAEKLRAEAAVTLSPGTKVPAGLGEERLPAGRYLTTTHVGPYDKLPDVWSEFMGEVAKRGQPGAGASLEIYRNAPGMVPDDELVTELYTPIK